MLLLYEGLNGEHSEIIADAENVTVSEKLNDEKTMEFQLPYGNEYGIDVGRMVECEGEVYIIINISDDEDSERLAYKCQHEFVYMAKRRHLPNIASTNTGDFIGVAPYIILEEAQRLVRNMGYNLANSSDLENLNMHMLGGDDTSNPDIIIDFESVDKTTLWDVLLQVIDCAGYGEIFFSSKLKAYGIVERIGDDTDIIISPVKNANSITVEYDITDMVTVLYPYGKEDLEISNAENNVSGTNYIISDNADKYGWVEGYRNYDYSSIEDLFARAIWEFDESNPCRIDVPSVNISGSVIMLDIGENIQLGDTITVLDKGVSIRERIIQIKKYPFSGKPMEVSIGRPAHDMFFYLRQVGTLAQRYKNISASNGKIYGKKVTGTVIATAETTKELSNSTAEITINNNGLRVLSAGGLFLSANKNNFSVGEAIVVDTEGNAEVSASKIALNNYQFTTDEEGNLYFDGKLVQLVQKEENVNG